MNYPYTFGTENAFLGKMRLSGLIFIIGVFLTTNTFAQQMTPDFLGMKGAKHTHIFADSEDSLSSKEIVELRQENGLPVWFGRDINKVVCLTGECRMVHLWLFWDAAANYLGFQLHEKHPLSKTDHTVFKLDDYQKLHRILADQFSVLKDLKQEELVVKKEKTGNEEVDAKSGATQPSLQELLVKNAAYTCYTLWHTVYGNTRGEVQRLLEQRVDSSYLKLLFAHENTGYLKWAIGYVQKNPVYHDLFYPQIISQIKNKDEQLSQMALNYFGDKHLADPVIQKSLVAVFDEISYQRKFEFIWKLSAIQQINGDVVLRFLQLFEEQRINVSLLGYVYKLIRADNLKNPQITDKLKALSNHENLYVRNITQRVLSGANN